MAKFTISILDKLIENSNNKDLTDFQNLTDVSKTTLFGSELNVISEEYRDRFVLSFTQEFLYDEIGFETFAGWRMALAHRIFDLAEKINWTFENLDKQVFANYSVNKRTIDTTEAGKSKTDSSGTTTADGTTATTALNTNTGTQSDETTGTGSVTDSGTSKNTTTGSNESSTTQGGTETTSKTATDTNTTTYGKTTTTTTTDGGTVTNTVDGDVTDTKTISGIINKDTLSDLTKTGVEHNEKRTTDTSNGTKTPSLISTRSEQEGNKVTEREISYSDTPQNGLSAVKDGNYLTNFTFQKETETPHLFATTNTPTLLGSESYNDNKEITESNDLEFNNRKDSTKGNEKTSYQNYEESNKHDDNSTKTETRDLTGSITATDSGSDVTKVDRLGTDTLTKDLTDSTTGSTSSTTDTTNTNTSESTNATTATSNSKNVLESKGSDTSHNESTNTNTNTTTNDSTSKTIELDEHYDFNYEMLMRATPYLKGLWREFDDLFFGLL